MTGLGITKNEGETWREAAIRYATKFHMQGEVEETYDHLIADGENEASAAWGACLEWDVLDFAPGEI